MAANRSASMTLTPFMLRVALGLIFLYYGAGKLLYKDFVPDAGQQQILLELGLIEGTTPASNAAPLEQAQPAGDARAPLAFDLIRVQDNPVVDAPADPATADPATADPGEPEIVDEPPVDAAAAPAVDSPVATTDAEPMRRLYGLVFSMHNADQRGHWPPFAASGQWLEALAWAAAVTEFAGGFFILLGVFTRLWAFTMLGTMAVAMWLTQISPALGTDTAFLGFLPEWKMGEPTEWLGAYQTLFFQLIIAAAAKSVMFMGPGAISIDRMIFGAGPKKKSPAAIKDNA